MIHKDMSIEYALEMITDETSWISLLISRSVPSRIEKITEILNIWCSISLRYHYGNKKHALYNCECKKQL